MEHVSFNMSHKIDKVSLYTNITSISYITSEIYGSMYIYINMSHKKENKKV